VANPIFLRWQ